MRKLLPLSILLITLLSSCTVTENLEFGSTSSTSNTDIHVQQFFVDVLEDYSEFMPSGSQSIMDSAVSTFADQVEATDQGYDTLSIRTGENEYVLSFSFTDLALLAQEMGGQEQTIIRQEEGSLSFDCNIDNYTQLERIVPFLADPSISVYLAQYNVGYSEQDYMDMIMFAIGEEAPEALRTSRITVNVTVPGTITSITGAEQTGSDSFTFSFPLIDFLLLAQPLAFSVQWV